MAQNKPKELELIKQLVGEFAVVVAIKTAEGKNVFGRGTMTAKPTPERHGVTAELDIHLEGVEDYVEIELWGFDQATGKMHMFSITSKGEAHDHEGQWLNDKTLELHWKGYVEGEELEEKITVTWIDKNQIKVKETDFSKGNIKKQIDYVFRRILY